MDFYLGIDIGTSRVKAVLFDQHFTACASAAENTSPRLSANGYAEQDMTQLWHSVLAILRQIARHPALQAGRLRAIGLARPGGGVWPSDDQGGPVGPGVLWGDTRSHALMSDLLRPPRVHPPPFSDTRTHLQP
ncbi:carbohydrate kinase, partial [Klebsiella pneumoniae]|uniref:FGGY family carbohydrate kinase n=1 Tax=Klebsiella pneumoniae TaxID=573 RepID=UPI000795BA13